MSYLEQFLDGLTRLHINGLLPDLSREKRGTGTTTYSSIWLKNIQDPKKMKGMAKARTIHMIVQGVSRIISIIYGANQLNLKLLSDDDEDDIQPEKQTVPLSLALLYDRPSGYSLYDAVDAITGQAIHMAAHLREAQERPHFEDEQDDKVLSVLYHLVEDVIVDQITTLQYPGFEGYLLKHRKYLIDEKLVKKWGQKQNERVNLLILTLRSTAPVHAYKRNVKRAYLYVLYILSQHPTIDELRKINREEAARQLYAILYMEKAFQHTRDQNYMSERLVTAKEGLTTEGEGGSNKGGKKGVNEKSGNHFDVENMEHMPITGQAVKDLINGWPQDFTDPSLDPQTVNTILKDHPADEQIEGWMGEFFDDVRGANKGKKRHGLQFSEMQYMNRLKEEEFTSLSEVDTKYPYQIFRTLPAVLPHWKEEYKEALLAVRQQTVLLRNQLSWANTRRVLTQYGLKTGQLDEDALYQAKYSREVFMNPIVENTRTRNLDLILLVDGSSSMAENVEGGKIPKYIAARELSSLFIEAMGAVDSVQTWVYTFVQEDKTSICIKELYSPKEPRKERIIAIAPGMRTPEYEALLALSGMVRREGRNGVQKVILILSDGQPGDDLIPYYVQKKKIRELIMQMEQEGDRVIQIALGSDVLAQEIYLHSVPFPREGYRALVLQFGKLLRNLL